MNTNRDFLVIVDCKNGTVVEKRPIRFFNTDRNVSNLFIKLVIPIYVENDVVEYAILENASDYEVTLNVIAPNNELKTIKSTLLSRELIFTIDFPISFTDTIGVYLCEFIISTMVNGIEEILTTEPFNYNVQGSISSNLGDKIEIEENLVQQLLEQIARLEEKVVTDDRDLTKFAKLTDLQTKVDREIGKSLISDTEIERLAQVDNYDDSGLRALINTKANQSDVPTKVSQLENDSNYATKSEIPTKVSQLENDSNYTTQSYVINKINEAKLEGSEGIDLSIYVTLDDLLDRDYVSNSELNTKGYITETEVSSNYAKKTELHSHSNKAILDSITQEKINNWESKTSFSGNYNDLSNKPTIPTKTSQLTNDSNFISSIPSEYVTEAELEAKGYSTFSGSYNDLTNKPTIPTKTSQLTNDSRYLTEIPSEYAKLTDLNGYATETFVNEAIANAKFDSDNIDLSKYAPIDNPNFTTAISMDRDKDSTVGVRSVALGDGVRAEGAYSVALGYVSSAGGDMSCAIAGGKALGSHSFAVGSETYAREMSSYALGDFTEANGMNSYALGSNAVTNGLCSYALGHYAKANDFCSYALGNHTIANGTSQFVLGKYNIEDIENKYAYIFGNGNEYEETRSNAYTLDWKGNGWYAGKVSINGTPTEVNDLTTKEYVDNAILNAEINSEGISVDLSNYAPKNSPSFTNSISLNRGAGYIGTNSVAINGIATKENSFALNGKANGNGSVALGGDNVEARGDHSLASGIGSIAVGKGSCAFINGVTYGEYSFASGLHTVADGNNQFVLGRLNIRDELNKYAYIFGNGYETDLGNHNSVETRSNAYTLDWNGNGWYQGEVYVGGTSQDDGNKLLSTADIYFDTSGYLCVTIDGITKKFAPM